MENNSQYNQQVKCVTLPILLAWETYGRRSDPRLQIDNAPEVLSCQIKTIGILPVPTMRR
jgi:hypothetical protein